MERQFSNRKICKFFTSPTGCRYGDNCRYYHPKDGEEVCNDFQESECTLGGACPNLHIYRNNPYNYPCPSLEKNGFCKTGKECLFSHGDKDILCSYFTMGTCNRGDNCGFYHLKEGEKICEDYQKNKCHRGSKCKNTHVMCSHPSSIMCSSFLNSGKCPVADKCRYSHRYTAANTVIFGPKKVIKSIAQHASTIVRNRHENNHEFHKPMKNLANGDLKRKERGRGYEFQLEDKLAKKVKEEEFIHFFAVPLHVNPIDACKYLKSYVSEEELEWIFKQQRSYLEGTVFHEASNDHNSDQNSSGSTLIDTNAQGRTLDPKYEVNFENFNVESRLKDTYKKISAEYQDKYQDYWYYLIGIEPLTVHACLSGFKSPTLCDIGGKTEEGEPLIETAIREAKEEGNIDISEVINEKEESFILGTQKTFLIKAERFKFENDMITITAKNKN